MSQGEEIAFGTDIQSAQRRSDDHDLVDLQRYVVTASNASCSDRVTLITAIKTHMSDLH